MPNITIKALEQSINRALAQHDGEAFKGVRALDDIFSATVKATLVSEGVTFFNPSNWALYAVEHGPIDLHILAARGVYDVEWDKRYRTFAAGKIVSLRINFMPEIQELTLKEARLVLYDMQRHTMLQNCERLRDEALAQAAQAEADGARLRALKFE